MMLEAMVDMEAAKRSALKTLQDIASQARCDEAGFDERSGYLYIDSGCGTARYLFDIVLETGQLYLRGLEGKMYTNDDEPQLVADELRNVTTLLARYGQRGAVSGTDAEL